MQAIYLLPYFFIELYRKAITPIGLYGL